VQWLRWGILGIAAAAGASLLFEAVLALLAGARNVMAGDPSYFVGAMVYAAIPMLELGLIVGVMIATALYRRCMWSVVRNAAVLAWLFAILDWALIAASSIP
jgi:hypothetical protein